MEFSLQMLTDYLLTGSVVIAFLILLFMNDRPKFVNFQIVFFAAKGLSLAFCPSCVLGFQLNKPVDDVSLVCGSVVGWSIIGGILVWYLTRETRDGTVPITLMTAQVFSLSVALMCQFYAQFTEVQVAGSKDQETYYPWNKQHMMFGMLQAACMLFANLVYLLRSHDFSSYPQHNIKVNEFLRLDAGLSMLLALCCLAFPDLVLKHFWPKAKEMSPVASHLIRTVGCAVLNTAFVSLQAAGFLHEKDKKKQFIGRLVGVLLLFIPFIQGALMKGQFTLQQIEWALLAMVPLAVNAVLGFLADGTVTTRPKFR